MIIKVLLSLQNIINMGELICAVATDGNKMLARKTNQKDCQLLVAHLHRSYRLDVSSNNPSCLM